MRYHEWTNIILLEPDITGHSRTMQQSTGPFVASSTRPARFEALEGLAEKSLQLQANVGLGDQSDLRSRWNNVSSRK
jgi:hypothetical protein